MGQNINIKIGNRNYELIADSPEKEESYRKAASILNDKIDKYQSKFHDKDMTDILSLIALQECMNTLKLLTKIDHIQNESTRLQEGLDSYLKNCKI